MRVKASLVALRPGVINPTLWHPSRPSARKWEKIREKVLERDNFTCCFCGHRAFKWMNVDHLTSNSNRLANLKTTCVACHAVIHIGFNLQYRVIEIWESKISQVEIVRQTRFGVAKGKSLAQIKKTFDLKKGKYPPKSLKWANDLVEKMGRSARAYLEEPLCAVFVKLERWQVDC